MSSLKTKDKKKKFVSKNITLDTKYNEKIKYFKDNKKNISNKNKNLDDLKNKLFEFNNKEELTDKDWEEKNRIKENINKLEKEINETENYIKENEYYLDAGEILFKYYDCMNKSKENKEKIIKNTKSSNKDNSIINLLYKEASSDEEQEESILNNELVNDYCTKAELLDSYMDLIEFVPLNKIFNKNDVFYCKECHCEKKMVQGECILYCPECGSQESILIDCEKPSYKDPPKEISYFAYKRINHFNEWLCQIQGKETTEIPPDVLSDILLELKKERVSNVAEIKTSKLKEILKKLHANKYYEHTAHIINKINGIPAPNISKELEERLRSMFKDIQIPFMKHCPTYRKNFLSYSYVLHKFIQLLEKDDLLKHFPLLKSREKLHEQDIIWKKICIELNWQFIKSI
jgi:hypothetical protein